MARRSDLEPRIIQEWLRQQPAGRRTEDEILGFFGRLQQHNPDLLAFRSSGDKYQTLKTILRNHIER
ncbi:hypothetical protein GCM10027159_05140 [Lysobacter terrae]